LVDRVAPRGRSPKGYWNTRGGFNIWLAHKARNRAKGQPIMPRRLTVVQAYYWQIRTFTHKIVEGHSHQTKPDVVVPVVRVVVVADRDARVVFIVVPRAATQTL
jgi:hypothetical protein